MLSFALLPLLASCELTTQLLVPPGPLPSVEATAVSPSEIELSWPSPPEDGLEIRIERARAGEPFALIAVLSDGIVRYRDAGLDPSTRYDYRVRVCAPAGCSTFVAASATTPAILLIATETLPDGVKGVPYNAGLNASGGANGFTWSLESGSLPAGLALSEMGILSGVPQTEQTAIFVVRVRSGDGQAASREFSITIGAPAPGPAVSIETPRLAPALAGAPYGVALRASGGDEASFVWSVSGGSLPAGLSLGEGGIFEGSPAGPGAFTFTVRATSAGHSQERSFTLEVHAHDSERFNLTAFEVAPVPPAIRSHLSAALARWEKVITGNLPAGHIPRGFFSNTFCAGFGHLVNGTSVDDLIVMIDISPIDGPGQILGQAGPCGLRSDTRLPFAGILTLDSDDLEPLVGTETLTNIIFHEIGHVLGFGGLWGSLGFLTGAGTSDPRFTGAGAVQAFQALGRSGTVPVEGTGGQGTADGHWRKSVFRAEIMTGFVEPVGTPQPLSRVTIASMADLGYTVNPEAADPFTLPAAAPLPAPAPREPLGYDVVIPGPVRFLPMPDGPLR